MFAHVKWKWSETNETNNDNQWQKVWTKKWDLYLFNQEGLRKFYKVFKGAPAAFLYVLSL